MQPRTCASGRNPDAPMTVPNFTTVYWNGDGIKEIADAMIASYQELSWLREGEGNYSIEFLWKQKGGMRGEQMVLGNAKRASAIARHWTGADFIIEMAADHCKNLANFEFEAALFHQLLHLGEREVESTDRDIAAKRSPVTKPHEVEMFEAEIQRYGFWSIGLRSASQVFHEQLRLDFSPPDRSKSGALPPGDDDDDFDTGGDEIDRRNNLIAEEVTAKGDGLSSVVWDKGLREFRTSDGDIYAAGAIEEAAGLPL